MTEVRKSFQHGFLLSEQELRRPCHLLVEQIKRIDSINAPVNYFKLEFKEGFVEKFMSLDQVVSQDNGGTNKIQRLEIKITTNPRSLNYSVLLKFDTTGGSNSIRYHIVGEDNNWVAITKAQLEARIKKIKRWVPSQLGSSVYLSLLTTVASAFSLSLLIGTPNSQNSRIKELALLEFDWKNGKIKDPVEAIILIKKIRLNSDSVTLDMNYINPSLWLGIILVFIGWFAAVYCFPAYNFYWGDYIQEFKRKQFIGNLILVGVLLGIFVSILSNWFSKKLGF